MPGHSIVICGDDRFTRRVIEACLPRLKVISKGGTGIDSIDRAAANELGVAVCNTPNAFTVPVSESVIGYMLVFKAPTRLDAEVKAEHGRKLSEEPGREHHGRGWCGSCR